MLNEQRRTGKQCNALKCFQKGVGKSIFGRDQSERFHLIQDLAQGDILIRFQVNIPTFDIAVAISLLVKEEQQHQTISVSFFATHWVCF